MHTEAAAILGYFHGFVYWSLRNEFTNKFGGSGTVHKFSHEITDPVLFGDSSRTSI